MAEYQLTNPDPLTGANGVAHVVDGVYTYIPDDPANRLWVEYQAWLADGNVPDPYIAPPPPPPSVNDQQQTAVLLDHENRLRAAAGDPPLTLADFIAKANQL